MCDKWIEGEKGVLLLGYHMMRLRDVFEREREREREINRKECRTQ